MKVADFLSFCKVQGLSISDSYDLLSYMLGIDYEKSKYVDRMYNILSINLPNIVEKIKNNVPVAYITGRREFYSLEFIVDKNTLIPRIETELLVDIGINIIGNRTLEILDLCTGSGAILLSILANCRNSIGLGIDTSEKAINIAKLNCKKFQLESRANFINKNAITFYDKEKKFDLVFCNPPYIAKEDYNDLEKSVKYEPYEALVAEDNGLFFYKKILYNINFLCKKEGLVIFEIGSLQKQPLMNFCKDNKINCEFEKDYSSNDRVMICYL